MPQHQPKSNSTQSNFVCKVQILGLAPSTAHQGKTPSGRGNGCGGGRGRGRNGGRFDNHMELEGSNHSNKAAKPQPGQTPISLLHQDVQNLQLVAKVRVSYQNPSNQKKSG